VSVLFHRVQQEKRTQPEDTTEVLSFGDTRKVPNNKKEKKLCKLK
jgi:hypothetical protein